MGFFNIQDGVVIGFQVDLTFTTRYKEIDFHFSSEEIKSATVIFDLKLHRESKEKYGSG